jgi:hypothetical protein
MARARSLTKRPMTASDDRHRMGSGGITPLVSQQVVVYLDHPLGDAGTLEYHDNIANSGKWLDFLVSCTPWVVIAPWAFYAQHLHGHAMEVRRGVDTLHMIDRCDMVVLCGGRLAPHSRLVTKRARGRGVPLLDLGPMGFEPPEVSEASRASLLAKARRTLAGRARRIWMPLLEQADIKAFVQARDALDAADGDHESAILMINRILDATTDPEHLGES